MTTKCDFHDRNCCYCLNHEIEAKKCKVDNLPLESGVCLIPCGECDMDSKKIDL